MGDGPFIPAPMPAALPRAPLIPRLDAFRREGARLGEVYGNARAIIQQFRKIFFEPVKFTVDLVVWDHMTDGEKQKSLNDLKKQIGKLSKAPPNMLEDEKKVFLDAFYSFESQAYEVTRFRFFMIGVTCDLALDLIMLAAGGLPAASPSKFMISAAGQKLRDCAARTAALIFRREGIEVSSHEIAQHYGLPRESITSMKQAVEYTKKYFRGMGIEVGEKAFDLEMSARNLPDGSYAAIMVSADEAAGHVVYAEVKSGILTVIDDQVGKRWTSIVAAQSELGLRFRGAFFVNKVLSPF